jgi:hypothetical protein
VRGWIGADRSVPPGSRREREREGAHARSLLTGGVYLSGDAGARVAWFRWIGPNGLLLVLLFLGNF